MKKIFVLLLLLIAVSCSIDNDTVDYTVEFLPVERVIVPESVTPGETYTFTLYYHKPTTCYYVGGTNNVNSLYYYPEENERTIAIQATVLQAGSCQAIDAAAQEMLTFNFQCPLQYDVTEYVFKFYKGEDAASNTTFLEMTVPVVQ
ncbi:hypothetical protein [Flavobacterium rhizosphaerae]|uniref:Lipoprotein n=1 Tax=Flavobacterium rhizosphaerae TaxID=3163298 RepID=A0ABW8YVU8_9FLAO